MLFRVCCLELRVPHVRTPPPCWVVDPQGPNSATYPQAASLTSNSLAPGFRVRGWESGFGHGTSD